MPRYRFNLIEDVWKYVFKAGEDECWLYFGCKFKNGYGAFESLGKKMYAHRCAYHDLYGDPTPLHVLHTCDVKLCCNPKHLFLGTSKDNSLDILLKGRQHSKLTVDQVVEIRKSTLSQNALAKIYNVSWQCIHAVIKRQTWKHI